MFFKHYADASDGGLFAAISPTTARPPTTGDAPDDVPARRMWPTTVLQGAARRGTVFHNPDGSPLTDRTRSWTTPPWRRSTPSPPARTSPASSPTTRSPSPGRADGSAAGIWRDPATGAYSLGRFRTFPAGPEGARAANDHAFAIEANQYIDISTGEVLNVSAPARPVADGPLGRTGRRDPS